MARRPTPSAKAQAAMQTITELFARYAIDSIIPDIRGQIRARFSQEDLDTYIAALAALAVVDGSGGLDS